ARPRLAVSPDVPTTLFHDSVDRGKPKASAATALLGGVEGLENVRHGFRTHAHPGIRYAKHHVAARLHAHVFAGVDFIKINVAGFHRQTAAFWHGVPRVHHKVHDDLFYLAWIRFDRADVFSRDSGHLDAFIHQAAKQFV